MVDAAQPPHMALAPRPTAPMAGTGRIPAIQAVTQAGPRHPVTAPADQPTAQAADIAQALHTLVVTVEAGQAPAITLALRLPAVAVGIAAEAEGQSLIPAAVGAADLLIRAGAQALTAGDKR